MFVAWLLLGSFNMHVNESTLLLSTIALSALGLAVVARRLSRVQSVALLSVLVVMFYQSLLAIAGWLDFRLDRPSILEAEGVRHFFSVFFTLNAGLAIVGAVAAVAFGVSLEFRNLRLPLARLFPEMVFMRAPSEVTRRVETLSKMMGVRPPQVAMIDCGDPAAFITSSRQGCVLAVSVGLLESLTEDELDACLGHELSHVKNSDFAFRSFATLTRIALFAHPLSHIIEPAVYRARELMADRTAADFVGANSLISALSKLRESQNYVNEQFESIGMACLFNPVGTNRLTRLFDKHPTLDARIRALKEWQAS
jgi:Zn-dependent protease with chaperone function